LGTPPGVTVCDVRSTREQVMMQVELVRLSCGEGLIMFCHSILTYDVKAHGLLD